MMNHSYYMQFALKEAKKAADQGDIPVGAIMVQGDTIVGYGHNTKESDATPLGHAEINAIHVTAARLARWRPNDCTLYVTMEPCPMCAGAILQARICRLVFGTWDPKWGAAGSVVNLLQHHQFNHTTEVISGICEKECNELLKKEFQQIRKKP